MSGEWGKNENSAYKRIPKIFTNKLMLKHIIEEVFKTVSIKNMAQFYLSD